MSLLTRHTVGCVLVCVTLMSAATALAQPDEFVPEDVRDIGITEQLGAALPLDATFTDHLGQTVKLGDYFNQGRPVILTLVYYECPMLCGLSLNALLDTLNMMPGRPGEDFEVVTVSFNLTETVQLAHDKRLNYIREYNKPDAVDGWHFLIGSEASVKALTEAVGFAYRWNEKTEQFAHSAALILVTPDGRVSRYMHGVYYEAKDTHRALKDAAKGLIAEPDDAAAAKSVFMVCYRAVVGAHESSVIRIMRGMGAASLVLLAAVMVPLWIRSVRAGRRRAANHSA